MKWKGRRQSDNFHIQTPKELGVAKQSAKIAPVLNERVISPEPIRSNRDAPMKEFLETMQGDHNPAKTLKAKDRPVNRGDASFFKHTIKDKKK